MERKGRSHQWQPFPHQHSGSSPSPIPSRHCCYPNKIRLEQAVDSTCSVGRRFLRSEVGGWKGEADRMWYGTGRSSCPKSHRSRSRHSPVKLYPESFHTPGPRSDRYYRIRVSRSQQVVDNTWRCIPALSYSRLPCLFLRMVATATSPSTSSMRSSDPEGCDLRSRVPAPVHCTLEF